MKGRKGKSSKEGARKSSVQEKEVFLYWADKFNASAIFPVLEKNGVVEREDARFDNIMDTSLILSLARQLGDWIEIDVDAMR